MLDMMWLVHDLDYSRAFFFSMSTEKLAIDAIAM
jgi:hypothetical protein